MKLYKVYQIYSVYANRIMTFKISTQDGTMLYWQQVKHLQKQKTLTASDGLGFVRPRNCPKQWTTELPSCPRLKTSVRLQIDQTMRIPFQSPERSCRKRSSDQESKKERKPTLIGRWESAFSGRQMDNVRKDTHVVSVMNWPLFPVAVLSRTKFEGQD